MFFISADIYRLVVSPAKREGTRDAGDNGSRQADVRWVIVYIVCLGAIKVVGAVSSTLVVNGRERSVGHLDKYCRDHLRKIGGNTVICRLLVDCYFLFSFGKSSFICVYSFERA